jgi:hypothetical protein
MDCIRVKQSTIDNAMQYVLIELFRNVFLEKTIMEIIFPINPMAIAVASIVVIVKDASDIFSLVLVFYRFFLFDQ